MKSFNSSHLVKLNSVDSEYFAGVSSRSEVIEFLDSIRPIPRCLMVTGPVGVGKSHLVSWICKQALTKYPDLKIGVKTEMLFATEEANSSDLIVIDDLDMFVSRLENRRALEELIADCSKEMKTLILICDEYPTTLSSVSTIHLSYPDAQARVSIAHALANSFELKAPIDYETVKSLKSPREIEGFVTRIKVLSELNQSASVV